MDREAVLISMTTLVIVMFLTDLFAFSVYYNGVKLIKEKAQKDRDLELEYESAGVIKDDDYDYMNPSREIVGNYYTKDLNKEKSDVKGVINTIFISTVKQRFISNCFVITAIPAEIMKPKPIAPNYLFEDNNPPPGALRFAYYVRTLTH